MIKTFKDAASKEVFDGRCPKGFPVSILKVARRKLRAINVASSLQDLAALPGNKLHSLSKDRHGQSSIWINAQFRVCFIWKDGDAFEVEIVDYH